MNFRLLALTAAILATGFVSGCSSNSDNKGNDKPSAVSDRDSDGIVDAEDNCPDTSNSGQLDTDADGVGDACAPEGYAFVNAAGENSVSYTGQTKRHVLIADMTNEIGGFTTASEDVSVSLNYYMNGANDEEQPLLSITGWSIAPVDANGVFTYGAIASGKNLKDKIAGGYDKDGVPTGETGTLVSPFFGWEEGLTGDQPLPIDLVNHYIAQIERLVANPAAIQIPTAEGEAQLDVVYVDEFGRDYKQLTQKFLLMAVPFSQGVNDYLQSDFANELGATEKPYTTAEHHWDEAFGYFGAARNYDEYTDVEIAAGDVKDTNGDGAIDVRSEYNFGQSTNCAKRDKGTVDNANPTNFTKEAFDAFLAGREILRNAAAEGELTAEAQTALEQHAADAALTWEKCIAATVVHYINDVIDDLSATADGTYTNLDAYKNLAKHWSEMKGFALGLQFSPYSPFRANEMTELELQVVLAQMGDAPVLADGTQLGQPYADGVEGYKADLLLARDTLQAAYAFDADNVANW